MKKRLNVKLVVWLVVAGIVLGVTIHALHTVQVKRTAGILLEQAKATRAKAQEAAEAGDDKAAFRLNKDARDFYRKYISYRPEDHEALAALALTWADIAESPHASKRHVIAAYQTMERALRQAPDDTTVRRRLAEFVMKMQRFHDAKEHLQYLLEDDPDNAELDLLLARCHVMLNENEQAVEVLQRAIEKDPHLVEAYRLLADVYKERLEKPEEATQVLDQMVANNQENYRAYFVRATHRLQAQQIEEARRDTNRALELAPDEAEVILLASEMAIRESRPDEALAQLNRGRELFPEDDRMYQALARLEQQRSNVPQAIEYLKQGLEAIPKSGKLAWYLLDLQLTTGEVEGAEKTLEKLRTMNFSQEMVDLMQARLLIAKAQWPEARDLLEKTRPLLAGSTDLSTLVELLLADCYRALQQPDLEREALRRALLLDPGNRTAEQRLVRLNMRLGQPGALEEFEQLVRSNPRLRLQALSLRIRRMLTQPKETRNWNRIEQQLDQLSKVLEDQMDVNILRSEVLYQKGQVDEAIALLRKAQQEHPNAIAPWIALSGIIERKEGGEAALKLLDEAEQKLGDSPKLRIARLGTLARLRTDEARQQLVALGQNVDDWEGKKRAELWRRIGRVFYRLRDLERAREFFTKAADQDPGDIESRLALFNLASEQGDLQAMDEALERIKNEDSYWNYGRAVRLVLEARQLKGKENQQRRNELLDQARTHIAKAAKRRPEWPDLLGLEAEVDEMQGRLADAADKYRRAIDLGGRRLSYYQHLAALYDLQGRPREAEELIQQMPVDVQQLSPAFSQFAANVAMQTGNVLEAEERSGYAYDENSPDFRHHLFRARILSAAAKKDEAEKVYRRAVELAPEEPVTWVSLIGHLVTMGKMDEARAALKEAALKLPEDKAPLALAQCYEYLKEQKKAEAHYMEALNRDPSDLTMARVVASYYLRTRQVDKARKLLAGIMKQGRGQQDQQATVRWARRRMAQLYAATGNYTDHQKALELIEANVQPDGQLALEDLILKGRLLAARADRGSRLEAIEVFEKVLDISPKHPMAKLALAQLYDLEGQWSRGRRHLEELCAEYDKVTLYKQGFIRLLIKHNELLDAGAWLAKLEEIDPDSPATRDAKARLWAARGQVSEAIALLENSIPPRPLSPEQWPLLNNVAQTLIDIAQNIDDPTARNTLLEAAERNLREYAELAPGGTLVLANFLGRYGDWQGGTAHLDEALRLCQESADDAPLATLARIGLLALREHRETAEPRHFEQVAQWIEQGLKESPDSAMLLLQKADLADLQGDYATAEQYYRKVLARDTLSDQEKGIALNNLAFLLATTGQSPKQFAEALQLIQEAIHILGPMGELLDTRAMVYLARQQTAEAIQDLEESIKENPSAVKYFHLAQAYLLENDTAGALAAIENAKLHGLKESLIPPMEKQRYQQVLQSLGLTSSS